MYVNTYWRWPKDGEVIPLDVIRDRYGRVLVMAEDIKKGDTIIVEYPPIVISKLTGGNEPVDKLES